MNARHIESIKRAIDNGYFKPISKPLTPEDARRLVDTALEGLHASL
jgi:DNA-binding NtrC family response regulator